MCQARSVLGESVIGQFRGDLVAADFTLAAVSARLGEVALAALGRNTTLAADRALGHADDPQATMIRLWVLGQPVDRRVAEAALTGLPCLLGAGLVRSDGEAVAATIEVKPYGWGSSSGWICCDQTPLDHVQAPPRDDFVLGASPASTTLAQLTLRRPVGRALDLGTGCGVQALHLHDHADEIVATDVNQRALDLARLTLSLNGVRADLRRGSLYEPVDPQTFDLIVTNPPYVMAPPAESHLAYREAPFVADGLMRRIVTDAPARLRDGGLLQVVGNWAITADEPWRERLAGWIEPTGCDALVLCREVLDPCEYVELWLADAGLAGTPSYRDAYRRWLDYFDAYRITGVGMGWLNLRRTGRAAPVVRIEDWPHAVAQPVGDAIGAFFDAADRPADDATLLDARLVVAPGVVQETFGAPGAADPEHLVLRQTTGLCRAAQAGTALAAVVGACDGELPLGVLIDATASLLDVPTADARTDLLPQLRELIGQAFLVHSV